MKNAIDKKRANNDKNKLSFGSALKKNVSFYHITSKIVKTKFIFSSKSTTEKYKFKKAINVIF
jgi:hypothetical protein